MSAPSPPSDPRTTPSDVREVMNLDSTEWPDADLQAEIQDAHLLVEQRLVPYVNEDTAPMPYTLHRVETYVAAHYLYPTVSGLADGADSGAISSESEMGVSRTYETKHLSNPEFLAGPNGMESPFWGKATDLDPTNGRLDTRKRDPTTVHID